MLIFSSWHLAYIYFSSRNMLNVEFLARKTCCTWIISSRNFLYLNFCFWETCYIFILSSWCLLHVDFSLRETWASIFLYALIFCASKIGLFSFFFMKLFASPLPALSFYYPFILSIVLSYLFFYVKVDVCWFSLSWNLSYLDIFRREKCCLLVSFVRNMMNADICLWSLSHVDYFLKQLNVF